MKPLITAHSKATALEPLLLLARHVGVIFQGMEAITQLGVLFVSQIFGHIVVLVSITTATAAISVVSASDHGGDSKGQKDNHGLHDGETDKRKRGRRKEEESKVRNRLVFVLSSEIGTVTHNCRLYLKREREKERGRKRGRECSRSSWGAERNVALLFLFISGRVHGTEERSDADIVIGSTDGVEPHLIDLEQTLI
jgi:hypothetical protein